MTPSTTDCATDQVITIDGPSGSGKSSTSRAVASELGWAYLDTGAMYRAVAWWMVTNGVDISNAEAVAAQVDRVQVRSVTDPRAPEIFVGEVSVGDAIREAAVTEAVSSVAAVPAVREAMVSLQRSVAHAAGSGGQGLVAEGRDMGTVVFPDAAVKIYLTADPAERAARRAREDAVAGRGQSGASTADPSALHTSAVDATRESLLRRDHADSSREASPLQAAADAVHIDGTHLELPEVVDRVIALARAAWPTITVTGTSETVDR